MLLPRRAARSFNETCDHATMGAPRSREGEPGVINDEWIWPRFDDFASPLCRSATGGSNRSYPIGAEQGYTPAQADLIGSAPGRTIDPVPKGQNSIREARFDQAVVAQWLNEARDQPQRRS
jgi:hypothetical protein